MRFDEGGDFVMKLRIISGPGWDTTNVYCTCGWDETYKTEEIADRNSEKHMADHERRVPR